MATNYWLSGAAAVKQVSTFAVSGGNGSSTFKITIGTVVVSVVWATTDNATASALQVLLAASTSPYFSNVTWTVSTNVITGTAGTAGVPYVAASAQTGGTGTFVASTTTASSGAQDWNTATNWSLGAVPVTGDDVIIKDSGVNILWNIAQSGVTLNSLRIFKSYTGKIGLDWTNFATSADGATVAVPQFPEYRQTYLAIGVNTTGVKIGENPTQAAQTGSGRICLDVGSGTATTIEVINTAASSSESGRPSVRLKANNVATNVYVRSAPGGVGVAIDLPGETSTIGTLSISDTTTASKVYTGTGTTLTTYLQSGGINILQTANTPTTVTVNGGTLYSEGTGPITTLVVNGGSVYVNSTGTITTLNANGGTTDCTQSNRAHTISTLNLGKPAVFKYNASLDTVTNFLPVNTQTIVVTTS